MPDGVTLAGERTSDQAGAALDIWVDGSLQPRFAITSPNYAPLATVYVVVGAQTQDSSLDQAAWRVQAEADEEFGSELAWLAASGDTANLLVGAPGHDYNGQDDCGASGVSTACRNAPSGP